MSVFRQPTRPWKVSAGSRGRWHSASLPTAQTMAKTANYFATLPDHAGFDRLPAGATVGAVNVNKCRRCRYMVGTPDAESGFEYLRLVGIACADASKHVLSGADTAKSQLRQARDPTMIDLCHQVNWSLRIHCTRWQDSGILIDAIVTQPDRACAHCQAHSKRQAIVRRQRLDCPCRRVGVASH